ncbi:hypothetical protein [Alkaliphilus pronyensis]|uniref:hypothetical protein n=1 Tax=Alkaliphilus pronyensis TaxID=1482732 RepID=UPI001865726E|nr:hypothetical protein [Alkaliphilus pronyensis]
MKAFKKHNKELALLSQALDFYYLLDVLKSVVVFSLFTGCLFGLVTLLVELY